MRLKQREITQITIFNAYLSYIKFCPISNHFFHIISLWSPSQISILLFSIFGTTQCAQTQWDNDAFSGYNT